MHGACKTPGMVNGGMRNIDACLYVRPSDRTTLERLVADGKTAQKIVARARIVLLSGRGFGTNSIQREARVSKPTVWRWQKAYMDGGVERLLKDRGTACRNARTRSGSRLTNGPRAIAVAVVGGNYRIFLCKKDRRAGQINKTALVLEQLPTRGACSRIAAERLQCLSALVPYISATSLSQISNFEWRGSCAGRVSRGPRRLPYPACDVSWIARERLSESCRTMPNGMEPARRSGAFAGRRGGLRSISIRHSLAIYSASRKAINRRPYRRHSDFNNAQHVELHRCHLPHRGRLDRAQRHTISSIKHSSPSVLPRPTPNYSLPSLVSRPRRSWSSCHLRRGSVAAILNTRRHRTTARPSRPKTAAAKRSPGAADTSAGQVRNSTASTDLPCGTITEFSRGIESRQIHEVALTGLFLSPNGVNTFCDGNNVFCDKNKKDNDNNND